MTLQREVRPPGVYPALDEPSGAALGVADVRVGGFVGVAAKGPLDQPVLLRSWTEFIEIFGQAQGSYLARSVEGFFLNGGAACYVVRVAHRPRAGEAPTAAHAASASRVFLDGFGQPSVRVSALNEGRWGNGIWVRFQQTAGARTLLTLDLDVGVGEARVASAKGFERGALVKIWDREATDYVVLTAVDDRLLKWATTTPIVRRYRAAGPTYLEVIELELLASLRDRRELFRGLQLSPLSRRYAPRAVAEGSRLVRLDDLESKAPLAHALPQVGAAERLAGGQDGADITAEDIVGADRGPAERSGLMALAGVEDVGLLAAPDAMLAYRRLSGPQAEREVQRVHDTLIDLCERSKDRFALLDGPPTKDVEELRKWRRRLDSSYAALYHPWISLASGGGELVPPSGHVAGVFARCDAQTGVHKAPANEVIKGAVGLAMDLSEDHLGLLHGDGINALRGFPGRGIRVWGARTVSERPEWAYVNVRRLFIMLRRSIEAGTHWAVFEPNDPSTWEKLSREVTVFLTDLWGQGYFAPGAPEECFFVKCDAETNSAEQRDVGQLLMEIGIAPSIPAEYLIFHVTQKMNDQSGDAIVQ